MAASKAVGEAEADLQRAQILQERMLQQIEQEQREPASLLLDADKEQFVAQNVEVTNEFVKSYSAKN